VLQNAGAFLLLRHSPGGGRYPEIDALRGLAIGLMVIYHCAYDLTLFGYYQANVFSGAWRVFGRVPAILFLLLVGGSLWLSYARRAARSGDQVPYRRYLGRGLKILGWGMVITLVSWAYIGQPVILFGILHLIGTATLLAYPFLKMRWLNLLIGGLWIAVGVALNSLPVSHAMLLWLGLRPLDLFQLDYFPLFPWFGVVLLGICAGQWLYPGGSRRFDLPGLDPADRLRPLTWLGRRSLLIYLLHQPFLFAVFTLAQRLTSAP
jgi:uncharacterized membrane protein